MFDGITDPNAVPYIGSALAIGLQASDPSAGTWPNAGPVTAIRETGSKRS